jgi:ATP-dependent DNA ligase
MPAAKKSAALPFAPPIEPMLAKLTAEIPAGDGWLYEPKWDGFRALVFFDGTEAYLQSRDLKPLARYFPELASGLAGVLPAPVVLDGEVVIIGEDGLDFDALLMRIHPAESRVRKLAAETPSSFVAFDLLADGADDLRATAFAERRSRLERAGARLVRALRRRRARRRGREARRRRVSARRARDAQDQAPAHRRHCRRRVPVEPRRGGEVRRLAAARPVRR